jgi:hypothetical protein
MMLNNPAESSQRSLGHGSEGPIAMSETIEANADLPDPMAYDVDIPL